MTSDSETAQGSFAVKIFPSPTDLLESDDHAENAEHAADVNALLDELAEEYAPPARTAIVMPAYNAAETLKRTVDAIPPNVADELILVDDCSQDATVQIAHELGLTVVTHAKNRGYGGNQKTCYRMALECGADYVVMLHPDFQYDPRVIGAAVEFLKLDICDVVFGSRIRSRREVLDGGMPFYKYIANRALTTFENWSVGMNLGDCHSGFRAYSRRVLETIPFERNSDDFVFDSQFLVQSAAFGFRLGDIPVPVRYFDEASSINFRRSMRYGLSTIGVVMQRWMHRLGLSKSALFEPKDPGSDSDEISV
ncbi:glycosyltransferase family 2 protein [Thalassoroseus pseudoceratinae]|uniref:glycosyltransferase family 2 protein n=1 Tax=Thalassoroseus pseudoceratinae TaxID=2713176 RepID=UPI001424283D|nr:glycosyltransferase family 2 protein [Thalassoroseus pseudoceratinae]